MSGSPALPKPVQQPHPPIIIGGHGAKRTPRLAAQFAAEFNMPFGSLDGFADAARSRAVGAPRRSAVIPARSCSRRRSSPSSVATRRSSRRRAAAVQREPEELRQSGVAGTVDEAAATLRKWQEAGAQRIYLQILDLSDLDHLDLIANEVAPQV